MEEENKGTPGAEEGANDNDIVGEKDEEVDGKDWKKIAEDQRIRAEKAERKLKEKPEKKEEPKAEQKPESEALSQKDVIALAKADVHDEDMDEVISHARFKGITVAEALKSSYIKSFIKEQDELRKSQQASHSSSARRSTGGPTAESVLSEASKGNIPAAGTREAEALFWARRGKTVPK